MKRVMIVLLMVAGVFGWQKVFDFSAGSTVFQDILELTDGTHISMMATQGMADSSRNAIFIVGLNELGDSLWTRKFGRFGYTAWRGGGSLVAYDDTTFLALACIGRTSYELVSVYTILLMNQHGDIIWSQVDTTNEGYGHFSDIDYEGNIISYGTGWLKLLDEDGGRLDYFPFQFADSLMMSPSGFRGLKTVKHPPYGMVAFGHANDRISDDYVGYITYFNTDYDTVWTVAHGVSGYVSYDSDEIEGVEVVSHPIRGYPVGFIGVGGISHADTSHHGYIVRTDMEGNVVWIRDFGAREGRTPGYRFQDIVWAGNETYQTRFAVLGKRRHSAYSETILFMISDTLDGDTLWSKTYEVTGSTFSDAEKIVLCGDGGFLFGGYLYGSTDEETWLCRVDSLGNDVPYSIDEPEGELTQSPKELQVTAHPNPFNSFCNIDIPQGFTADIYDIRGNLVHQMPEGASLWNADGQPSGIYIVKATSGKTALSQRIVLIK